MLRTLKIVAAFALLFPTAASAQFGLVDVQTANGAMVGLGVDTKDLSKVRGTCIEGYKEIEAGNIFGATSESTFEEFDSRKDALDEMNVSAGLRLNFLTGEAKWKMGFGISHQREHSQ